MDMLYWLLIAAVFIIAFVGLVYPVIPSVVFILPDLYCTDFYFHSVRILICSGLLRQFLPQYYSQQIMCRICLE